MMHRMVGGGWWLIYATVVFLQQCACLFFCQYLLKSHTQWLRTGGQPIILHLKKLRANFLLAQDPFWYDHYRAL